MDTQQRMMNLSVFAVVALVALVALVAIFLHGNVGAVAARGENTAGEASTFSQSATPMLSGTLELDKQRYTVQYYDFQSFLLIKKGSATLASATLTEEERKTFVAIDEYPFVLVGTLSCSTAAQCPFKGVPVELSPVTRLASFEFPNGPKVIVLR